MPLNSSDTILQHVRIGVIQILIDSRRASQLYAVAWPKSSQSHRNGQRRPTLLPTASGAAGASQRQQNEDVMTPRGPTRRQIIAKIDSVTSRPAKNINDPASRGIRVTCETTVNNDMARSGRADIIVCSTHRGERQLIAEFVHSVSRDHKNSNSPRWPIFNSFLRGFFTR